ncbi:MAG: T9SS type A sorting domain-containing protein [Crocinitomicaceae bacterium]
MALDLNGNTLIQKRFGELENQYFNDIHQYSATDMYFVGAVYENNEKQAWFKIVGYQGNDNGGQYWQLAGGDTEVMATITYPGTFYLLNTFNSNTPGFSAYSPSYDFMVCKVSPGAWWTSAFIYGFTEDDYGNDLIPTQDLGALVIGSNADVQIGGRNLTLIKIGANDLYPPNDFDSIYPVTSSIEEYEIKELRFYPNPVSTNLYIQIDDFFKENYQYKIVSFSGQVLEESKLESQVIPTDFLSKGMYFIQVWSDKETYQSKFLKE